MTTAEARKRIDLSRRTIEGWEAIGMPGGRVGDNLVIISAELRILDGIAVEHPSLAGDVRDLTQRYGALAMKIRLSVN